MIIDSSIFVAIAHKEDGFEQYTQAIMGTDDASVSTATVLETFLVLSHQNQQAWQEINNVFSDANIETIPFDNKMMEVAMVAHKRYGKGQGNKAKLNYGDCFSYATAKSLNEPLLFIGNDFTHTDIESVL